MFSTGQMIFAVLFAVTFIVIIAISYRKDIKLHRTFYKGNYKVLIGFTVFIILLFMIKIFFKR